MPALQSAGVPGVISTHLYDTALAFTNTVDRRDAFVQISSATGRAEDELQLDVGVSASWQSEGNLAVYDMPELDFDIEWVIDTDFYKTIKNILSNPKQAAKGALDAVQAGLAKALDAINPYSALNDPEVAATLFGGPEPEAKPKNSESKSSFLKGSFGWEVIISFEEKAKFFFAYDTSGLRQFAAGGSQQPEDIAAGFLVRDDVGLGEKPVLGGGIFGSAPADSGGIEFGLFEQPFVDATDPDQLRIGGGLTLARTFEIPVIFQIALSGGLFPSVTFNLNDPIDDGVIRSSEIDLNASLNPSSNLLIFDPGGRLEARVKLSGEFLSGVLSFEIPILNLVLLDFDFPREQAAAPILAAMDGTTLRLNMGPFADERGSLTSVINESFTVSDDPGSNGVFVSAFGFEQLFPAPITRIEAFGGSGNDTISIDPNLNIPVLLDGGDGDDQLLAGGGIAELIGGAGDDILIGGPQNDVISGGNGDDTLEGRAGNDMLDGGDGSDVADGQEGNDIITGGSGADVLSGGEGHDILTGGDGDDDLFGDAGTDTISGGFGSDQVEGGSGNDQLDGGEGNDVLLGGLDVDTIRGGGGDDLILGEDGADILFGDAGQDEIYGGAGNDEAHGGDGDDTIEGGANNDTLFGDAGADLIRGGSDSDTIFGGSGNDLIFPHLDETGGPALGQIEFVDGGPNNDIIWGTPNNDLLGGGTGDDEIHGLSGNDLIFGGAIAFDRSHVDLANPSLFERPPGFDDAEALQFTGYSFPILVTPKIVGGQSLNGVVEDGDDRLFGNDGTDWLFGGSNSDTLFGGAGPDYLDAGAGNDANVFGGLGDDVVRGGANNDTVHGGPGVDQVYGDGGRDELFGDADTVGQKLFGGADEDFLYAYAAGDNTDATTPGDQLFGGPGPDFLFGNLRSDFLSGDSGKDFLSGDALAGPHYATNSSIAFNKDQNTMLPIGSDDILLGGTGEDQLYGGGGKDELWGGADSDWLEGQDDNDVAYGGSGIDILVVDTNSGYQVFGDTLDGHKSDGPGQATVDDNATDILLVEGTSGSDTIRLRTSVAGEQQRDGNGVVLPNNAVGGQLLVEYNLARIEVNWLDGSGTPLVEQFRIAGLLGDDTISFASGAQSLDFSQLTTRGDFVSTIDGGPGVDLLVGTPGRDRIDGGFGDDTIYGLAGDDRLWGDQGPGRGSSIDHDILFAGQGNDDLIGGQGTNELYAWTFDPDADVNLPFDPLGGLASSAMTQFGVFVDENGELTVDDGNLLDPYPQEDTGLNRMLGGDRSDKLFGGTGLDFLYGAGGVDELRDRNGVLFENQDGGIGADDGWKEYAQSVNNVWYVGGSNANDQISVDFVTEPGILQGHHLVTRLTENNGAFSFAAQLRLDFAATDDDGNLIWKTDDTLFDLDALSSDDPFQRADALNMAFQDGDPNLLGSLLPPEDDFPGDHY